MAMNTECVAVFIDGDNVSWKHADKILTEIKTNQKGHINILRVYADTSRSESAKWIKQSKELGFNLIYVDQINGKNSVDLKMSVDIMECLYTLTHLTHYYIVASDSDYKHVMEPLKRNNKTVHCICNKKSNVSLRAMCDDYKYIDTIINQSNILDSPKSDKVKISDSDKHNYFLIMAQLIENNELVNLSLCCDTIKRVYNDFDLRNYKCKSFTKFIQKYFAEEFKIVTRNTTSYLVSK